MDYVTADLCDAHPDMVEVVEPLFNNLGGRLSFGGQVVTIKCFEDNSLVKEEVEKPGKGKVMVVDAGGSFRCAMLGDMLAGKAVQNGWEGIIMYGCIRDVDIINELDIGVQALGTHPKKSEKRGVGEYQIPVAFGGVTFVPGDYIYADNDGIIVSPEPLTMPE